MASNSAKRPDTRQGFKIGIICALVPEAGKVEMVFDEIWDKNEAGSSYSKATNDPNAYTMGSISGHHVVLVHCVSMGSITAAQAATWMKASFTDVKIILVVGICGAVPFYHHLGETEEIVLGDCLISTGVIQYDFGRKGPKDFVRKDGLEGLGDMRMEIKGIITKLQTPINKRDLQATLLKHLQAISKADPKVKYPGREQDLLYNSSYTHTHQHSIEACENCDPKLGLCGQNCQDLGCDSGQIRNRKKLQEDVTPTIHFGNFGSSSTVLRSGLERDKLSKAENIIAFEMEGAGVWNTCATIMIKSACDYADSHKNKQWQPYAAATAASGLKAFLEKLNVNFDSTREETVPKSSYMVPFFNEKRFVGRKKQIEQLESRLFIKKDCYRLAIFGLGGVGKTQLALAFCRAVKARYPEYSIFWVSALSFERFKQDYVKIASHFSIGSGLDEDELLSAVCDHMSCDKAGKWLLVVDNADSRTMVFDKIADRLPRSESGIILFTTRSREVALDLADFNVTGLDEMDMEEAQTFLKQSLNRSGVQLYDGMEELLEELTFLPLAIVQATSYIGRRSITIAKYLDLMRSTEGQMIELLSQEFRDDTREKNARNAVAVTWLISFELIKEENPTAAEILFMIAFFENKAIPLSMLPTVESDLANIEAIGILKAYSMLTEQTSDVFDVHRLVHCAIKKWMQQQSILDQWQEKTISHLAEKFPDSKWEERALWQQHLPHAIKVLQDSDNLRLEDRAELSLRVGNCLMEDGRIDESLHWISEAVQWRRQLLSKDNPQLLDAEFWLSGVLDYAGKQEEAIEILERVFAIEKQFRVADDLRLLNIQHWLAHCYSLVGRTEEAICITEDVVKHSAALAEDNPYRLAFLNQLAELYNSVDRHTEAIQILENVVEVQNSLILDSPNRLSSLHKLAKSYHSNGRTDEAIQIMEGVLQTRQVVLAEHHHDRLASQHELARYYHLNGRTDETIQMMENVVRIEQETLAESHPSLLTSQHNLATYYHSSGRIDEAIQIMENVVRIQQNTHAEHHQDRLTSQHELALYYHSNGRTDEAIQIMESVVRIRQNTRAEAHPSLLMSQHNLARCYFTSGRKQEALLLMQHVVGVRKKSLAHDNPDRLNSEADLSYILDIMGDTSGSADMRETPDISDPVANNKRE